MKAFSNYINEKLKINKDSKDDSKYIVFFNTKNINEEYTYELFDNIEDAAEYIHNKYNDDWAFSFLIPDTEELTINNLTELIIDYSRRRISRSAYLKICDLKKRIPVDNELKKILNIKDD